MTDYPSVMADGAYPTSLLLLLLQSTWVQLLDWEEAHSDVPRTITTYERCLVPW